MVGAIGFALAGRWREFRDTPLDVAPRWEYVVLSAALVLATYALLIETWRRILAAWGDRIAFLDAARIWCVSNLGKYVPGKIWQIGAMGVMAETSGVSPAAAAGSAIVSVVVNVATGLAVALIAAWRAVDVMTRGHAALGIALIAAILGALSLAPALLPFALDWLRRTTGREIALGAFPHRAIYIAVVGNTVAWIMYGVAFRLFVVGILGAAPYATTDYIAAYASSYVIGYLAFVVPGGVGVREGAQTEMMVALGLATLPQAGVVAVTSRLWLTVLEIVPGLYFWTRRNRPRAEESTVRDGST